MIIDAHAHIYPTKIAEKATVAIGEFYDLKMSLPAGTSDKLVSLGKLANIDKYIVHSCATKSTQVSSINDFINSEKNGHKEFIGFMTLHQDLTEEEIFNEIDKCIKNGFYGIKLHPDFQKFDIDGEKAHKFYNVLSGFNKIYPILFHTGDNRYDYSKPYRLANIAKEYPNLIFIGAHFGGYRCWDMIDVYKGLDNVFFDTCSSLPFIGENKAKELINKFGAEKFFFGTDFPMWNPLEEMQRFNKIKIDTKSKEMILGENLKTLLNL